MAGLPLRSAIFVFGLAAALPVSAQLYKWTDANGRVQYSDRPPAHQQADVLGRSGAPAKTAYQAPADESAEAEPNGETAADGEPPAQTGEAAAPAPASWAEKEQAFRKRRMEAEEARQKQAKLEAEKKAQAEACERSRNYLKSVEAGRRISRTNAKGEVEILDDDQRRAEAERTRQDLSQHCS